MRALLTGITGNLGHEVALNLAQRSVEVVPLVRPEKESATFLSPIRTSRVVGADLLGPGAITFEESLDCVVHCAGDVQLHDTGGKNEQMMRKVLAFAIPRHIPVHFVSTAFVHRGREGAAFRNRYEEDKFKAEEMLRASGLAHSILRPSVLVGNSVTGALRNFSGYYLIAHAFATAARAARSRSRILRFPMMHGRSDMVPVDQAAERIGHAVATSRFETVFVTNPEPRRASWVLQETLDFYAVQDTVELVDVPFEAFGALHLTEEEAVLYRYAKNFQAYWSMEYRFPNPDCTKNLIDHEYMKMALSAYGGHTEAAYA